MSEDTFAIGLQLAVQAYVYFEDNPGRRGLVNRLSGADAKAVAQMMRSRQKTRVA